MIVVANQTMSERTGKMTDCQRSFGGGKKYQEKVFECRKISVTTAQRRVLKGMNRNGASEELQKFPIQSGIIILLNAQSGTTDVGQRTLSYNLD